MSIIFQINLIQKLLVSQSRCCRSSAFLSISWLSQPNYIWQNRLNACLVGIGCLSHAYEQTILFRACFSLRLLRLSHSATINCMKILSTSSFILVRISSTVPTARIYGYVYVCFIRTHSLSLSGSVLMSLRLTIFSCSDIFGLFVRFDSFLTTTLL